MEPDLLKEVAFICCFGVCFATIFEKKLAVFSYHCKLKSIILMLGQNSVFQYNDFCVLLLGHHNHGFSELSLWHLSIIVCTTWYIMWASLWWTVIGYTFDRWNLYFRHLFVALVTWFRILNNVAWHEVFIHLCLIGSLLWFN